MDYHQHDHYPVPRRRGGSNVVAACGPCHDLKDRISLTNWDKEAHQAATYELADALRNFIWDWSPPEDSDFFHDLPPDTPFSPALMSLASWIPALEKCWASLSPLARILLARTRGFLEDIVVEGSDQSDLVNELNRIALARDDAQGRDRPGGRQLDSRVPKRTAARCTGVRAV
jgi:hypothetical protein